MSSTNQKYCEDNYTECFKYRSKKNPFLVPYNYFEKSEVDIIYNVLNQQKRPKTSIVTFLKPLIIAAVFALIFFSFFWFDITHSSAPRLSEKEVRYELSKMDATEIEYYLINNIDDVNEEELMMQSNSATLPIYKEKNDLTKEEKKQLIDEWSDTDNTEINI